MSGKDKVKVGEKMLSVRISRFNPADQSTPKIKEYSVKVHEGARVLDVLKAVRDTLDPTLLFRHCCGAGQCGSCALKVNGEPRLACMTEAADGMLLEPLDLPVIRDLVTGFSDFSVFLFLFPLPQPHPVPSPNPHPQPLIPKGPPRV